MMIGHIQGATRILGRGQEDFKGLPIYDHEYEDGRKAMWSAWIPTPDELELLAKGAPVYLMVMGTEHPPCTLIVGEVPQL